ncbi:MAG TPA: hypothetical protein VFL85_05345, partial [Candidatus Saccharimonadales bacterium]|nr:hypothetical protein [Candidatus Saccharimonadales bacterium]
MNPNTPFSPYDSDIPPVTPTQENAAQQPPDSPYMQQNSPTPAQAAPQATVQPQPNWPAYMYENPAGYRPAQPQYPGGGSGPQPSYGLSYAAAEAPQYRSSTSKLKDMVIAVIALLIVGGGTTFALLSMQKEPTPDQAFKASLDHALSTSSYTQVSTQKIGEQS